MNFKSFFDYRRMTRWLGLAALAACAVASADNSFLRPTEAYRFEARADGEAVTVTYRIREGYYLYGKRFGFSTDSAGVSLSAAELPPGLPHTDEYFGEQEIYRGTFAIRIPYHRDSPATTALHLLLRLQGCADAGLCYPPQNWSSDVALPPAGPAAGPAAAASPKARQTAAAAESTPSAHPASLLAKLVPKASPAAASVAGLANEAAAEFLPPEQAFDSTAAREDGVIRLRVTIAPGYYLYRDRFRFELPAGTRLGTVAWPPGEIHHDDYFGDQTVYRGDLAVDVPTSGAKPTQLIVTYQGCADAGLCYTPQRRTFALGAATGTATTASAGAEQDRLARLVRDGQWWAVVGAFWLFGLLLAFTPCVLPMVPILAGIIAGDGPNISNRRAFSLAVAYVGGMAVTYTAVGVAFAAAGAQAQATFQKPWILVLFAALFVALAFAMFGYYELALPSGLQTRLAQASQRIRGGRLLSTTILGALSSLIVTACVAPPLVATFVVISEAGAIGRGALALGALSVGMGTPLLLVGASAGRLLPKSGPWMETVKSLFGVIFLGVAVWTLDRLLPARVTMAGWALVALALTLVVARVGRRAGRPAPARWILTAVAAAYAVLLAVAAMTGGTNPLQPWQGTPFGPAAPQALAFQTIKSEADLDRALAAAAAAGRPTMVDFSADWCVSCKEMDAHTFRDPRVQAVLAHFTVLRADVTANDADDAALLHRFGIFGPPTTAFFKADGAERRTFRLVGYVDSDHFLQHLARFEAAP